MREDPIIRNGHTVSMDAASSVQGWGRTSQKPWPSQIDLVPVPGEFGARVPAADEVYTPEILALTQDSRPRLG